MEKQHNTPSRPPTLLILLPHRIFTGCSAVIEAVSSLLALRGDFIWSPSHGRTMSRRVSCPQLGSQPSRLHGRSYRQTCERCAGAVRRSDTSVGTTPDAYLLLPTTNSYLAVARAPLNLEPRDLEYRREQKLVGVMRDILVVEPARQGPNDGC